MIVFAVLLPRLTHFGGRFQSAIVNQPQTTTHTKSKHIEHPFNQTVRLHEIQNHQNSARL